MMGDEELLEEESHPKRLKFSYDALNSERLGQVLFEERTQKIRSDHKI